MAVKKTYTIETGSAGLDIHLTSSATTISIKQGEDIVTIHAEWIQDLVDSVRELQDDLP